MSSGPPVARRFTRSASGRYLYRTQETSSVETATAKTAVGPRNAAASMNGTKEESARSVPSMSTYAMAYDHRRHCKEQGERLKQLGMRSQSSRG
jgi:hypothetical protein